MNNYFSNIKSVNDIKSHYRALAMQFHPDRNPAPDATRIMQEINAAYVAALEASDGFTEIGSDDKEHTYHYNPEHEQAIMDKINELIGLKLAGIEIWLIGKWIWVMGNTRPVKEELKKAGLIWHGKRLAWYWKPYYGKTHYNAGVDLEGLAEYYGAEMFNQKHENKPVVMIG
jgi:hypothetical protein